MKTTQLTQSNKLTLACKSGALAMILALTACGGSNEHTAAVDKVDEAAAAAREATPEPVLDEPATITANIPPADTAVATADTVSEPPESATTEPTTTDAEADVQAAAAGVGKELYDSKCSVCHNAGVAGAPKLDDAAAWQARLAQGQDVLYQSVINGKGAMPPRATANDATDAELKAAVDYMTGQVIK